MADKYQFVNKGQVNTCEKNTSMLMLLVRITSKTPTLVKTLVPTNFNYR